MIYPNQNFMTVQKWANLLPTYYPTAQIPIYTDPWSKWAAAVIKSPIFSSISVPSPVGYSTWYDWAQAFYNVANYTINGA